jgi:hypothetical protein
LIAIVVSNSKNNSKNSLLDCDNHINHVINISIANLAGDPNRNNYSDDDGGNNISTKIGALVLLVIDIASTQNVVSEIERIVPRSKS